MVNCNLAVHAVFQWETLDTNGINACLWSWPCLHHNGRQWGNLFEVLEVNMLKEDWSLTFPPTQHESELQSDLCIIINWGLGFAKSFLLLEMLLSTCTQHSEFQFTFSSSCFFSACASDSWIPLYVNKEMFSQCHGNWVHTAHLVWKIKIQQNSVKCIRRAMWSNFCRVFFFFFYKMHTLIDNSGVLKSNDWGIDDCCSMDRHKILCSKCEVTVWIKQWEKLPCCDWKSLVVFEQHL